MMISSRPATLVLIDVQKGLDDPWFGQRNNLDAEKNIICLLTHWRSKRWPVVHVQHASVNPQSPLHRDLPGFSIKEECAPQSDEKHFVKQVNSAFIDTGLEKHLRDRGIEALVICGLTAEHCVSTSVRHAGNLGFRVTLASDATASFECTDHNGQHFTAVQIYDISLATLNEEFCCIRSTSDIVGSSDSEKLLNPTILSAKNVV